MLRWLTAPMAVVGLAAAAPPHQQPTPAPLPQETRPSDLSGGDIGKAKAAKEKGEREQAARNREWDAKLRIPTKPAGDSDLKPAVIPRRSRPPVRSQAGQ